MIGFCPRPSGDWKIMETPVYKFSFEFQGKGNKKINKVDYCIILSLLTTKKCFLRNRSKIYRRTHIFRTGCCTPYMRPALDLSLLRSFRFKNQASLISYHCSKRSEGIQK